MWSENELLRPSFCECGSMVRMSPWLDQRSVFPSAGIAINATVNVAAISLADLMFSSQKTPMSPYVNLSEP